MTDLDNVDPPKRPLHPRHVCQPQPLPAAQAGLMRIPIVAPSVYVPLLKDVTEHFQNFAKTLRSPTKSDYDVTQRAKTRAEKWHERHLLKSGLRDLKSEYHPALMRLICNQAVIVGPRTTHDVDELFADIHAETPWFAEVSTFLMHRVRADVAAGRPGFCPPPIILVGRPGDGKSQYARSLAQRLTLPYRQIDVGSGTAGFRISGLERGWASAMPGSPVETIVATGVGNPAMIVDEVDKSGSIEFSRTNQSTSIATSLLQVLEPQTAANFDCPFYRVRFDLRSVVWILTANSAANLPDPLRDRCRVFHIQPPTPDQIFASYDRLSAGLDDDLREIGRKIIMQRLKTVKGFNLRAMHRLIDTLNSRVEDPGLH